MPTILIPDSTTSVIYVNHLQHSMTAMDTELLPPCQQTSKNYTPAIPDGKRRLPSSGKPWSLFTLHHSPGANPKEFPLTFLCLLSKKKRDINSMRQPEQHCTVTGPKRSCHCPTDSLRSMPLSPPVSAATLKGGLSRGVLLWPS